MSWLRTFVRKLTSRKTLSRPALNDGVFMRQLTEIGWRIHLPKRGKNGEYSVFTFETSDDTLTVLYRRHHATEVIENVIGGDRTSVAKLEQDLQKIGFRDDAGQEAPGPR